jgi:hypothetical protein
VHIHFTSIKKTKQKIDQQGLTPGSIFINETNRFSLVTFASRFSAKPTSKTSKADETPEGQDYLKQN